MSITPTMEQMAIAVLRGDEAAAMALADVLQEGRAAGVLYLPPISRLTVSTERIRVALLLKENCTPAPGDIERVRGETEAWIRDGRVAIFPPGVDRIELYEMPPEAPDMAAVTPDAVKIRLGIPVTDTSEDDAIGLLIPQAQALVEKSLGFPIERHVARHYLEGTGREWLTLRHKPVTAVVTTGTTAVSSTTISALNATACALIIAGMPVVGDGVPDGAVVSSVSSTSVVISAACTATATGVLLTFGLAVWLDVDSGAGGQSEDSFGEGTLLTPGTDYSLHAETSLSGVFTSSSAMLWRRSGWPRPQRRNAGSLAPNLAGPVPGTGNAIRCVYSAGWAPAAIPADIQMALLDVIGLARESAPGGMLRTSESFDGYSYGLQPLAQAAWLGYLGSPGALALARYRRMPV